MLASLIRSAIPSVEAISSRFFGIECKAGKNKPTPLQQKNLDDIPSVEAISSRFFCCSGVGLFLPALHSIPKNLDDIASTEGIALLINEANMKDVTHLLGAPSNQHQLELEF